MHVILRENVENLGRIGDLVKVSDGYARNYLIPRKLVVIADEQNKAEIEHQRKLLEKKRLAAKGAAQEIAKKLAEVKVTIARKVGEADKLFGSVSNADIAEALKAQGLSIEKRTIQIEAPIKALGVHTVSVRLESDISAELKVWVVKEA
jgi:large subunit ribosomal protein L9